MTLLKKLIFSLVLLVFCATAAAGEGRTTLNWNYGWTFARVLPGNERTQDVGAMKPGDAIISEKMEEPVPVRLPHDWAIAGPFDEKSRNGGQGKLPWRGVGWYFKTFELPKTDTDRAVILDFDGCMAFPEVYVNGIFAGGWDYGYVPFQIDITKYLKFGEKNTVAVRCDVRKHASRWYPGAGIYRNVKWIQCSSKARLPMGSVFVSTPEISNGKADVAVSINADVDPELESPVYADVRIFDSNGKTAAETFALPLQENGGTAAKTTLSVIAPKLWSPDSPKLYSLKVTLRACARCSGFQPQNETNREMIFDEIEIPFGIRSIEWTADDGFHLNGKRLQLKGVNLHHDQGICGAASHPAAIERQLRIMKEMGVNAIRTSHNPNSAAFMDLCDQMGFIVWNELFDKWDATVDLFDQTRFDEFTERQARQLVYRDRNRPSVCVWSIGNEVFDVEHGRKGSSNPFLDGPRRVRHIADCFRKFDPTRKTAFGCCVSGTCTPDDHTRDAVDVIGWNYGAQYRKARIRYPEKTMVYSESASAVSTRGYYELPHPGKKDQFNAETHQIDGYDWCSVPWGDIPDVEFDRMEKDRYVAGEFVWTGFDYLGEPSPFNEDARSSYFGIVDLCGIPKDRYFLYRSYWNQNDETLHILPHWNWKVGDKLPVYLYSSGDSAELFLNGKSLGKKAKLKELLPLKNETLTFTKTPPAISASSSETRDGKSNTPEKAFDADSDTRWCASSERNGEWLRLDFEKEIQPLGQIITLEQHAEKYRLRLEISADGQTWETVFTHERNSALGNTIQIPASAWTKPARSFRLIFDETVPGTWASVREWRFTDELSESNTLPPYYAVIDKYRLRWEDVPYEPGILEAVAFRDGKEIGRRTLRTAGETAAIRLTPEKTSFGGNDDLIFILAEAVDEDGVLSPNEMRSFSVSVEGPAELVGIGNGNPMGYDPLTDGVHQLFYGKAMIVLRSTDGNGKEIRLKAVSEGIQGSEVILRK
ncbi:MAG: DUF4982 domain-containing protein [Thermoguttaceae bacterium]|nr:DUF4982 domain-containing protein [Thermoguttaceae bacterium]